MNLLSTSLQGNELISPWSVLLRLLAALALGSVVAFIYRKTAQHPDSSPSFPMTLILLSVLIAMVAQVIGSNVALAFSLVGALSVVRFRTVVRDTRDTAYVIFAVVVGMAVGAAALWVAILGILVIGAASFVSASYWTGSPDLYSLRLRCALGHDPNVLAADVFKQYLSQRDLLGVVSSKQGLGLDYHFAVGLQAGVELTAFVNALNVIEGIQDVRIERMIED
ncbi:MAG: DUF4956 domain-containing protein [Steroidobacteraceae bacterium]